MRPGASFLRVSLAFYLHKQIMSFVLTFIESFNSHRAKQVNVSSLSFHNSHAQKVRICSFLHFTADSAWILFTAQLWRSFSDCFARVWHSSLDLWRSFFSFGTRKCAALSLVKDLECYLCFSLSSAFCETFCSNFYSPQFLSTTLVYLHTMITFQRSLFFSQS